MKRVPKFYPEYKYEVKYLWELVADTLILEPWSEAEIAQGEAEAAAQWERFGVEWRRNRPEIMAARLQHTAR